MPEIKQTERASRVLCNAVECCKEERHEFVTPEHLLLALLDEDIFEQVLDTYYRPDELADRLYLKMTEMPTLPGEEDYEPEMSAQLELVVESAHRKVLSSSAKALDIPHLVKGIFQLEESWACYMLRDVLAGQENNFLSQLISFYEFEDHFGEYADTPNDHQAESAEEAQEGKPEAWQRLVTCMNDHYQQQNPLIGRERELQRTIQVLCRRDKNNPLHVGEPGVGKTALVWGLARMIEEGRVPEKLKGTHIYQLDLGTLLAGTQYRGDFENRIKLIMDGIQHESKGNIVYIDEIHTLVGAGATSESALDASNMLKPYLEGGNIRFIGSTTYEEYNRHLARSKGIVRRFQQIDIGEPSTDEAKHILNQLKPRYEEFHGVTYTDEAITFAVEASAKHVNDRFLPDKAIDLIDEAGAAAEIAPATEKGKVVEAADIADVLAKTCKVDAMAVAQADDYQQLETLPTRMLAQIYGQDEAITQVVEAVQMSRAGLLDDNKPLASLLFVGPTGVGKTEVARVLAKELGIELIRFDMSEYTEKHAVAKLIGSPAGYVGYEDGGLLTDAIRKTPNCVLLLDEIEKAHQDIYNILLQVMDYARLTDNKGRKADFRNVILIMTSNAGAQFASQGSIGFNSSVSRGEAMMKQVKKTFKPEFLNRLSGAVVFHDMDKQMATLILRKKLRELEAKLEAKEVSLTLTPEAFDHLLKEGFTAEYGAREMDRVIAQQLKPLLMREILFGSLKHGGNITIALENSKLTQHHNS
ncbi:MAG: ATP-dependent Clp protease ATP-binding subunit ClpA [Prevotella sp.]|nr:ATP-dependent Clp protease ATP-binding subunit ClpA [Prevotella sp.]